MQIIDFIQYQLSFDSSFVTARAVYLLHATLPYLQIKI